MKEERLPAADGRLAFLERMRVALGGKDPLHGALRAAIEHFHAESGTLHLLGPDGHLHLEAAAGGIPEAVLATVRTVPVGKGMAGLAVLRREPVTACNIQTDTSGDVRPGARATGLEGAIVVPVFSGDEAAGALGIANRSPREFTSAEKDLLIEAGRRIGATLARPERR